MRRLAILTGIVLTISSCSDAGLFVVEPSDTTPPDGLVETTQPPPSLDSPATVPNPLTEDGVGYLIAAYLPDNIIQPGFGGEMFCGYEMYGWEQTDDVAVAWLWTYCGEYYLAGGELALGTATSQPVAIHMAETAGEWMVSFAEQAGDGDLYADSVREMFPPEHAERALSQNRTTRDLATEVEHAARSQLAS